MKVCFIAGGKNTPSSTFRGKEYIPYFKKANINFKYIEPKVSRYPPQGTMKRAFWLFAVLLERFFLAIYVNKFDVVILQRELVSSIISFEFLIFRKVILDVDDSIHLKRKGFAAKYLARKAQAVVCGNKLLAEFYKKYNSNVFVIPTGIDSERYYNMPRGSNEVITVGWIGTSSNFPNLIDIEEALLFLINERDVILKIVSDKPVIFKSIPDSKVEFILWRKENDVIDLNSFDIGIMPLINNSWNAGKCSFKLLQYLSCEIPSIASPVGFNDEVIKKSKAALAASNIEEWKNALLLLVDSYKERKTMGENGRVYICDNFSLLKLTKEWEKVISSI